MKTRLLKKVRKRYYITRVDELASNVGEVYRRIYDQYGLPFYVLSDSEDSFGIYTRFFKTYDNAREKLCEWIISDYGEKFRHKDEKSTKVWWSNKIN